MLKVKNWHEYEIVCEPLSLLLQVSWNVNAVILNVELPQITVLRHCLVERFQCFVGTCCLYHKGIRM